MVKDEGASNEAASKTFAFEQGGLERVYLKCVRLEINKTISKLLVENSVKSTSTMHLKLFKLTSRCQGMYSCIIECITTKLCLLVLA